MDYFEILGVAKETHIAEAKRQYKMLLKKHHPDKGGNSEDFRLIQDAWEQVKDKFPLELMEPAVFFYKINDEYYRWVSIQGGTWGDKNNPYVSWIIYEKTHGGTYELKNSQTLYECIPESERIIKTSGSIKVKFYEPCKLEKNPVFNIKKVNENEYIVI